MDDIRRLPASGHDVRTKQPEAPAGRARRPSAPSALEGSILRLQRAAGNAAVGAMLGEATLSREATAVADDEASEVQPGQMRRTEFLQALEAEVRATAEDALAGTGNTAADCPAIERWFGFYRTKDAAHLNEVLGRFVPATRGQADARAAISLVTGRVAVAVRTWSQTGAIVGLPDVPEAQQEAATAAEAAQPETVTGTADAGTPDADTASTTGGEVTAARSVDPAAGRQGASGDRVRSATLGDGAPIEAATRGRLEPLLDVDLGRVRVHTGPEAAQVPEALDARAVTVGSEIAFASGEYRPGTVVGDAVLAHELAHVGQQEGDRASDGGQADPTALEDDADRTAAGWLASAWSGSRDAVAALGLQLRPRLRSGLRLSRCGRSTTRTRPPDQHAGIRVPDVPGQATIFSHLFPSMHVTPGSGGASPTVAQHAWDGVASGAVTAAQAQANRNDLRNRIVAAVNSMLDAQQTPMADEEARYHAARLPMTSFEGAGDAAKATVDGVFGSLAAAAALTPGQRSGQHAFRFTATGANRTLLDAFDLADRVQAGQPVSAVAVLQWAVDRGDALAAQRGHHFTHAPGSPGEAWLVNEVISPMATGPRQAELERWDRFGFAITTGDMTRHQVVLPSTRRAGLSNTAPGSGGLAPSERAARWDAWKILVHEYLHTLEHPTFLRARGATEAAGAMGEGFCEYFTKQVLDNALPRVASNEGLRRQVEGAAPPAPAPSPPDSTILSTTYDYNDSYRPDVDIVLAIRPTVGEAGLRAAFFQGHVETLGLRPDGSFATPVPTGTGTGITLPAGLTSFAAVAARFHVGVSDLQAANPGVPAGGPLPGRINVPGWREHVVVSSRETLGASPAETVESKAQIATQNGVTEADLDRANPGQNWAGLHAGSIVLIPPH